MPEYETSLIGLTAIPIVLGALGGLLGPWAARQLGAARVTTALTRVVSLGLMLVALWLGASAGEQLAERPVASLLGWTGGVWLEIGKATTLDLEVTREPIGLVFAALAVVWGLSRSLLAVARERADDHQVVSNAALVVGGVILAALADSALTLAIGWQIAGVGAARSGARGRGWTQTAWADGALWIGLLAVLMATGNFAWTLIERACVLGEDARFVIASYGTGLADPGLSIGAVAAGGLALAAGLRMHASAAGARPMMLSLGALTLLRFNAVIGLAPWVRAALIVVGGALVLRAVVRERGPDTIVVEVNAGLVCVAAGVGAWVAVVLLAIAGALASTSLHMLASAAPVRWTRLVRWLFAGVLPGVSLLGVAAALTACITQITPYGLWLNVIAGAAVLVGVLGVSLALARPLPAVAGEASLQATRRGLGGGLALVSVAAAALAIPGIVGPAPIVSVWARGLTAVSTSYPGIYASGLMPWIMGQAERVAQVALMSLALCWVVALAGAALGARWRPRAPDLSLRSPCPQLRDRVTRTLAVAGHPLDRVVVRALAGAGAAVSRLHERSLAHGALVLVLAAAAVLAHVFMNPAVSTVGPSRAYPVDLGGLSPKIVRPRSMERRPAEPAPDASGDASGGAP
ncbi:MAG: hypothetical protein H6713_16720 [Myxococcales bacterium]|nr:hypothetical protein [Myxococcales bacterium]